MNINIKGDHIINNSIKYSSFFKRLFAFLIDVVVVILANTVTALVLLGIIQLLLKSVIDVNAFEVITSVSTTTLICVSIAYFALFEASKWQGTIGKRVAKIIVTDITGRRLGYIRSFIRTAVKLLTVWGCFGFVFILFTRKKQALHDLLAKTIVVYKK